MRYRVYWILFPLIGLYGACSLIAPTDEELFGKKGDGGGGGGGVSGVVGGKVSGATGGAT